MTDLRNRETDQDTSIEDRQERREEDMEIYMVQRLHPLACAPQEREQRFPNLIEMS